MTQTHALNSSRLKNKAGWLCLLLTIVIFLIATQGCAPKTWDMPEMAKDPDLVWKKLQTRQDQDTLPAGYRLRANVHYHSPRDSSRVTLSMWGNTELPLRLKMRAGIGGTFSQWYITRDHTLAYYPREEQAFLYADQQQGLLHAGLELPFSVQEIGAMLMDSWSGLLPAEYKQARKVQGLGWEFEFHEDSRLQSITIDHNLRIIQAQGTAPSDWKLELEDFQAEDDFREAARRLDLDLGRKGQALFRIQELELRPDQWPEPALELELPPETEYVPLI